MSYSGLPTALASLVRCPKDGSALTVAAKTGANGRLWEGSLDCSACGCSYPIVEGVARLLQQEALDAEGLLELKWRDGMSSAATEASEAEWESSFKTRLEFPQHVAALKLTPRSRVLELGCGNGRFTLPFSRRCSTVLGVDFSIDSLRFLARRLAETANVGLIQADITSFKTAPGTFDRVFSTTSLDSREQRLAMHRVASEALTDDGRYVFSTEHYSLYSRWLGHPRVERYTAGGGLFCRLTRQEVTREAAPYFLRVQARPIQIYLPLGRSVLLGRIAEWVPGLRQLGNELLITARTPMRVPEVGEGHKGSRFFRYLYRRLRPGTL